MEKLKYTNAGDGRYAGVGYSHLCDTEAPIIPTDSKAPNIPTVFLPRLPSFRQQKWTMIVIKELTKP